jgi:hypothetical protein
MHRKRRHNPALSTGPLRTNIYVMVSIMSLGRLVCLFMHAGEQFVSDIMSGWNATNVHGAHLNCTLLRSSSAAARTAGVPINIS